VLFGCALKDSVPFFAGDFFVDFRFFLPIAKLWETCLRYRKTEFCAAILAR
jgi:hypothetical protein